MTTGPAFARRFLAARLDRSSYLGLHLTAGLLAMAAAIWAFGALVEEVLENSALVRFDVNTSVRVHLAATPAGTRIASLVSNAGSPATMSILAVVGAALLWRRHRLLALTWLAAAIGGGLLDVVLKLAVRRHRPTYGTAYLHVDSFSFPSGHAMAATIGLGMLAYVVWSLRPARAVAVVAFGLAAALTLLVAASRVYLGVHFPSDVLGGAVAGLAWLAICLTGAEIAGGRRASRAAPTN